MNEEQALYVIERLLQKLYPLLKILNVKTELFRDSIFKVFDDIIECNRSKFFE